MLVLKAVGKVIWDFVLIVLILVILIALFVGVVYAIVFVGVCLDSVIGMVVGVAGWTAAKAFLGNLGIGILIGLCILGILFLFGAEVYGEYQRQKKEG